MPRYVLRPICWRKGHQGFVEQYVELLPLPILVCERCGKSADDETQIAFYRETIRVLVEGR